MLAYILLSLMQTTCGRKSVFHEFESVVEEGPPQSEGQDQLKLAFSEAKMVSETLFRHIFARLSKDQKDAEKEDREHLVTLAENLLSVAGDLRWPAADVALDKLADCCIFFLQQDSQYSPMVRSILITFAGDLLCMLRERSRLIAEDPRSLLLDDHAKHLLINVATSLRPPQGANKEQQPPVEMGLVTEVLVDVLEHLESVSFKKHKARGFHLCQFAVELDNQQVWRLSETGRASFSGGLRGLLATKDRETTIEIEETRGERVRSGEYLRRIQALLSSTQSLFSKSHGLLLMLGNLVRGDTEGVKGGSTAVKTATNALKKVLEVDPTLLALILPQIISNFKSGTPQVRQSSLEFIGSHIDKIARAGAGEAATRQFESIIMLGLADASISVKKKALSFLGRLIEANPGAANVPAYFLRVLEKINDEDESVQKEASFLLESHFFPASLPGKDGERERQEMAKRAALLGRVMWNSLVDFKGLFTSLFDYVSSRPPSCLSRERPAHPHPQFLSSGLEPQVR